MSGKMLPCPSRMFAFPYKVYIMVHCMSTYEKIGYLYINQRRLTGVVIYTVYGSYLYVSVD
jgi:hypothetical protein